MKLALILGPMVLLAVMAQAAPGGCGKRDSGHRSCNKEHYRHGLRGNPEYSRSRRCHNRRGSSNTDRPSGTPNDGASPTGGSGDISDGFGSVGGSSSALSRSAGSTAGASAAAASGSGSAEAGAIAVAGSSIGGAAASVVANAYSGNGQVRAGGIAWGKSGTSGSK